MKHKDYYAILGVSRKATGNEIRKAFFKLSRQYHPDVAKGKDMATAQARFQEINEAYETLSDEEKRKRYDEGLSKELVIDLPTAVARVVEEYFDQFI